MGKTCDSHSVLGRGPGQGIQEWQQGSGQECFALTHTLATTEAELAEVMQDAKALVMLVELLEVKAAATPTVTLAWTVVPNRLWKAAQKRAGLSGQQSLERAFGR